MKLTMRLVLVVSAGFCPGCIGLLEGKDGGVLPGEEAGSDG